MVVAQGSDGTRCQSSDSLVPFPPSWKPKEEGAGKGIGLGNEYIGQDTCVCKRQNPIQIYLGRKKKDRSFAGAGNREVQDRFGPNSAEFRNSVMSSWLRVSLHHLLTLSHVGRFSGHLSYCCDSRKLLANNRKSSALFH